MEAEPTLWRCQKTYENALKVLYQHHANAATQARSDPTYEDADVWLDNFVASLECWYGDIGAADSLSLMDGTPLGTEIRSNLQQISETLHYDTSHVSEAIALDRDSQNPP